jgi:hypothetical protein
MKKLIASLLMMAAFSTACASTESKMKLDVASDTTESSSNREVAQAGDHNIVPVERPESLKYDSQDYKKHKEYIRYLDTHDKR